MRNCPAGKLYYLIEERIYLSKFREPIKKLILDGVMTARRRDEDMLKIEGMLSRSAILSYDEDDNDDYFPDSPGVLSAVHDDDDNDDGALKQIDTVELSLGSKTIADLDDEV